MSTRIRMTGTEISLVNSLGKIMETERARWLAYPARRPTIVLKQGADGDLSRFFESWAVRPMEIGCYEKEWNMPRMEVKELWLRCGGQRHADIVSVSLPHIPGCWAEAIARTLEARVLSHIAFVGPVPKGGLAGWKAAKHAVILYREGPERPIARALHELRRA